MLAITQQEESRHEKNKKIQPTNFTPTIGAYSGLAVPIPDSVDLIFVTGKIALDEHGGVYEPHDVQAIICV